jgi:hypothetical protein
MKPGRIFTKCSRSGTRVASSLRPSIGTPTRKRSALPCFFCASLHPVTLSRCKFFWFSCVDVPVFRQPDDPNKCPYNTWQDLLEHLKGQPQWKEWRSAPVQQRPKLSKPIVVMFHPDKFVEARFVHMMTSFTCSCSHRNRPFAMANCQRENQNSKPRSWATEITSVIGGLMDQDRIEVRSKK